MTPAQKHAARLREFEAIAREEYDRAMRNRGVAASGLIEMLHGNYLADAEALKAGAEALEAQGEWRIMLRGGKPYLVPAADYKQAIESPDLIGSAVHADDVVITGWRR